MMVLILAFGVMTFLAGAMIVARPDSIYRPLRENSDKLALQVLAVGVRLAIGSLLIRYAGGSRFPVVIEVLGWLSIAAAIVFGVMGRQRFVRLMSWALSLSERFGRAAGFIAMAFGGFLVYAFL